MQIRPVDAADRRAALGRLMSAGAVLTDAQHDQVVDYAERLGVRYEHLWAGYDERGALGPAALVVARPGRSAMVFASAPKRRADVPAVAAVIDAASSSVSVDQVRLLQALVDPEGHLEAESFTGAGFFELAMLAYMQRSVPRSAAPPAMPPGVTCLSYRDALRGRFGAALEASYENTLDCPGLRGLRSTEDVLDGHQGTGQFDPALWTLLVADGRDAGVILVNRLDEMDGAELVYLGLAEWARGQGHASRLVRRALAQCAAAGAGSLTLAADQSNAPAARLYKRLGFYRVARKRALLRRVSGSGDSV